MPQTAQTTAELSPRRASAGLGSRLEEFLSQTLEGFPWEIVITDWEGRSYSIGRREPHWRKLPLRVSIHTEAVARDLLGMNGLGFLERYAAGEADIEGNVYLLSDIRDHARLAMPWWRWIPQLLRNRQWLFQDTRRAGVNVKSHYDIAQEALNVYLDRAYQSYSCAMFEHPERLELEELLAGASKDDSFDSLEKAQWRKFQDAADFVAPGAGEQVLDVGCGYAGQLEVLLDSFPEGKIVGWTHSQNQVVEGRKRMARFDPASWELHEGDFREDRRTFDQVTSTGMISHVGPRGLAPYVRNVRERIKKGGRYLHHSLMTPYTGRSLDAEVGIAFNKKYVWPGFHWFTLGDHVRALEQNGFEIVGLKNLSPHYGKTTAAWYERLMSERPRMAEWMGEPTVRAWQIYLAGASEGFIRGACQVCRLYCRAV